MSKRKGDEELPTSSFRRMYWAPFKSCMWITPEKGVRPS
jgi:hypothetical protein